jgi:hypothetical protein
MGSALGITASLVNCGSKQLVLPPAAFQTSPVVLPLLLIFLLFIKNKGGFMYTDVKRAPVKFTNHFPRCFVNDQSPMVVKYLGMHWMFYTRKQWLLYFLPFKDGSALYVIESLPF